MPNLNNLQSMLDSHPELGGVKVEDVNILSGTVRPVFEGEITLITPFCTEKHAGPAILPPLAELGSVVFVKDDNGIHAFME